MRFTRRGWRVRRACAVGGVGQREIGTPKNVIGKARMFTKVSRKQLEFNSQQASLTVGFVTAVSAVVVAIAHVHLIDDESVHAGKASLTAVAFWKRSSRRN